MGILELISNCKPPTSPDKKDTWCSCKIIGYSISADGTDDFHLTRPAKTTVQTVEAETVQLCRVCGEIKLCFLFFPPAFKILWLWIYFVAKIPTFHSFTVLAPNRSKGHAILVSSLLKSPFFSECLRRLLAMSRDSCRVYVGDLGSGGSKPELEREFERYGPLKSVWVARNPPGEKICTAPKLYFLLSPVLRG